MTVDPSQYVIALDIGSKRVGIALANCMARLPAPYKTLAPEAVQEALDELQKTYMVTAVVVGLPRNLNGDKTDQTAWVQDFVNTLQLPVKPTFQDEALTSVKAQELLPTLSEAERSAGLDAVAAAVILQDYLTENWTSA